MSIQKRSIQFFFVFMLIAKFLFQFAFACSPTKDYWTPSNYVLVKEADAIVLAEPIAFHSEKEKVTFKILDILKGNYNQNTVETWGYDNYLGKSSNENEFNEVRPGALIGTCNAFDFQKGKRFVLFLRKYDKVWDIYSPPFSLVTEEVSGIDAPWAIAVKHYARISALKNYETEKVELSKLQDLAKQGFDPKAYPPGLIQDIEEYFTRPDPYKSYQDLLSIYYHSNDETVRNMVLWSFVKSKHREAKTLIKILLQSKDWKTYEYPITEYVVKSKDRELKKLLDKANKK